MSRLLETIRVKHTFLQLSLKHIPIMSVEMLNKTTCCKTLFLLCKLDPVVLL